MKILIIGATGKTGKELVKQALEKGHLVTVLARKPCRVRQQHPHLKIIKGDVLFPESLQEAVQGQEAVLSALGHHKFILPTSILSRGTSHVIEVMKANQVERFLAITAMGIGDNRFRLGLYYTLFIEPLLLYYYFRDK